MLVGRRRETERVAAFVRDIRESGEALVLVGEPGMGKTALTQHARALAEAAGTRVLDLVEDPGSGQWTVARGNRLLRQLASASSDGPLLVIVDDADRRDDDSIAVLAFVGRRLPMTQVGLLLSTRPSVTGGLDRHGLSELELPPLSAEGSAELLHECCPDLAESVSERVLADARGCPLAILELPTALSDRQRHGLDPLPLVLPLTHRLSAAYDDAFEGLGEATIELLVTAAVARPGDLEALRGARSAASRPGFAGLEDAAGEAALGEAEERGLLVFNPEGQRVQFLDPLARSALIERVGRAHVQQTHSRLADALVSDPDRRLWHLAAGVDTTDAGLSHELEKGARRALARGDVDAAVAAMVRAAELSDDQGRRSARLAAAARLQASVSGDLGAAATLMTDAATVDPASTSSLDGIVATAQLMVAQDAHLSDIRRLLIDAVDGDVPAEEESALVAALQLLFYVCLMEGRPASWAAYRRLVDSRRPRRDPTLTLLERVIPDLTLITPSTLEDLDSAILELTGVVDPGVVIRVSIGAFHVDRLAECRGALSRLVDDARRGRSVSSGTQAMLRLSLDDCLTGQLARAAQLAEEGLRISQTMGHGEHTWPFQLCLALAAAMRGEQDQVDVLTRQMFDWALDRGALLVEHHCAHVRGLAALGVGSFEAAYQYAASISPAGTLVGSTPVAVWASLDLVEAAAQTGRTADAQAHASALVESGIARLSPRLALRTAAAAAIAAPDSEVVDRFEHALALRHVDRWPFEVARVELAYGERLRRLRLTAASHDHLWSAHETFRRLDTRPWAVRAAEQMRAAGQPVPQRDDRPAPALSSRDLQIATLAAEGLTNREIGAKLFLSPRTVGARLYHIFPKLGVSSRAALRDALDALSPEA
jgi:DNA-binding CsgD family transcriptional regulator